MTDAERIAAGLAALRPLVALLPTPAAAAAAVVIVALEALLTPAPPTDTQDVVTPRPE